MLGPKYYLSPSKIYIQHRIVCGGVRYTYIYVNTRIRTKNDDSIYMTSCLYRRVNFVKSF